MPGPQAPQEGANFTVPAQVLGLNLPAAGAMHPGRNKYLLLNNKLPDIIPYSGRCRGSFYNDIFNQLFENTLNFQSFNIYILNKIICQDILISRIYIYFLNM